MVAMNIFYINSNWRFKWIENVNPVPRRPGMAEEEEEEEDSCFKHSVLRTFSTWQNEE